MWWLGSSPTAACSLIAWSLSTLVGDGDGRAAKRTEVRVGRMIRHAVKGNANTGIADPTVRALSRHSSRFILGRAYGGLSGGASSGYVAVCWRLFAGQHRSWITVRILLLGLRFGVSMYDFVPRGRVGGG